MIKNLIATSVVILVVMTRFGTPLRGDSPAWSRFRGGSASGVQPESTVPVTWSDTENLCWRLPLPGRGSSSPVIWQDRIYLTAYTGYGLSIEEPGDREQLELHVLAISLDEGNVIWDQAIDPADAEQPLGKRVAEHGYASPTPCVDSSGVYAAFGPSGLVALTHDGQTRWRQSYGTKTAGFGAAASPVLHDGLVIINGSIESGSVYAFEKTDGQLRWKADSINRAWTTPSIVTLDDGRQELIVNQKDAILGLDPKSGERLWWCDAIEDYIVPCILSEGETLYCSGGRSNRTFCVRAGGRGDVTATHVLWSTNRGANVTTPVLTGGYLFWSHDKALALCVRASDGEEMFRRRLPTRSRVYASMVGDSEKLFLTTRDAGVLVISAKPEYEQLAINRLGDPEERFNATPAIVGDRLILRSDRALYCIGNVSD